MQNDIITTPIGELTVSEVKILLARKSHEIGGLDEEDFLNVFKHYLPKILSLTLLQLAEQITSILGEKAPSDGNILDAP